MMCKGFIVTANYFPGLDEEEDATVVDLHITDEGAKYDRDYVLKDGFDVVCLTNSHSNEQTLLDLNNLGALIEALQDIKNRYS